MSLDLKSKDGQNKFIEENMSKLIEGVNDSYGPLLVEELMGRLRKTIDEFNDGMDIHGGIIEGNTFNSFGDHRIAMTALLASLVSNGDIIVEDTVNIDTSFPEFIEIANNIGMDIKTYD